MGYEYIVDQEELLKVVTSLESMQSTFKYISADFESSGLDVHTLTPWLFSIHIPELNLPTYVINVVHCDLSPLKALLESSIIIGGNLSYDLKILRKKWNIRPRRVFDVIIVERLLSCGLRKGGNSLEDCSKRYLGIILNKNITKDFIKSIYEVSIDPDPIWNSRHLQYAMEDVTVVYPIMNIQLSLLEQKQLIVTANLENRLVPNTCDIEYYGIKVDKDKWLAIAEEATARLSTLYTEACNLLAGPLTRQSLQAVNGSRIRIDLNSAEEVKRHFNRIGVKLESSDQKVLARIKHPAAAKVIEYRRCFKQVSSYGMNWLELINPVTGRVHSHINQVEADSGRYSSSDPSIMNIPTSANYRECFVAETGNVLTDSDYSQVEMRLLAEFSNDPLMIKILCGNGDLHSETASIMFDKPLDQCGKDSEWRKFGKALNFSIVYGLGDEALAKDLDIPIEDAKKLKRQYFDRFAGIKSYLYSQSLIPKRLGYAETFLGRKRFFDLTDTNPNLDYIMSSTGKNHPIQGSACDMLKISQVAIADTFIARKLKAGIVNTIHDENLVECEEGIKDEVVFIVEQCMIRAGQIFLKKVPVKVDTNVATYWRH